jgi:hypothetical protein
VRSDHQAGISHPKKCTTDFDQQLFLPYEMSDDANALKQKLNQKKKSASSRSSSGHFSRAAKPSNAHGALNPEGIFAIPTSPENQ